MVEPHPPGTKLWSPWRSRYIETPTKGVVAGGECVFCHKVEHPEEDTDNLVLLRGRTCYICLNLYPYNAGHLLVNPNRHLADLAELEEEEHRELFDLVRRGQAILRRALNPGGFNVGINLGPAAGAGIAEHLHVHVIPRWAGDTNFMPTTAEIRVISQNMQDCYERLLAAVDG
jgi:ATP adenylyltransferase